MGCSCQLVIKENDDDDDNDEVFTVCVKVCCSEAKSQLRYRQQYAMNSRSITTALRLDFDSTDTRSLLTPPIASTFAKPVSIIRVTLFRSSANHNLHSLPLTVATEIRDVEYKCKSTERNIMQQAKCYIRITKLNK